MFHFFKGKEKEKIVLTAPVAGTVVALSKVPDPTFGEEILGKGIAVIPSDGKIYAPADGTIDMVFDTLHALSMTTLDGVEVLVHIGLETVALKGAPFTAHVKAGDAVKRGELLITADLDAIKAAGLETITPMVICNTTDFETIEGVSEREVKVGDEVLTITAK